MFCEYFFLYFNIIKLGNGYKVLDSVLKIVDSLNRSKVDYVIIGGYAIILHGFLRATEDIDVMVKMNEENIQKFREAIEEVYPDENLADISFEELKKYPVIRYGTPDNFYIDIISEMGTEFSFEKVIKESKKIEGVEVYFATAKSLYEMKKNTYREKDNLDIIFLKEKLKDDSKI